MLVLAREGANALTNTHSIRVSNYNRHLIRVSIPAHVKGVFFVTSKSGKVLRRFKRDIAAPLMSP